MGKKLEQLFGEQKDSGLIQDLSKCFCRHGQMAVEEKLFCVSALT